MSSAYLALASELHFCVVDRDIGSTCLNLQNKENSLFPCVFDFCIRAE